MTEWGCCCLFSKDTFQSNIRRMVRLFVRSYMMCCCQHHRHCQRFFFQHLFIYDFFAQADWLSESDPEMHFLSLKWVFQEIDASLSHYFPSGSNTCAVYQSGKDFLASSFFLDDHMIYSVLFTPFQRWQIEYSAFQNTMSQCMNCESGHLTSQVRGIMDVCQHMNPHDFYPDVNPVPHLLSPGRIWLF